MATSVGQMLESESGSVLHIGVTGPDVTAPSVSAGSQCWPELGQVPRLRPARRPTSCRGSLLARWSGAASTIRSARLARLDRTVPRVGTTSPPAGHQASYAPTMSSMAARRLHHPWEMLPDDPCTEPVQISPGTMLRCPRRFRPTCGPDQRAADPSNQCRARSDL